MLFEVPNDVGLLGIKFKHDLVTFSTISDFPCSSGMWLLSLMELPVQNWFHLRTAVPQPLFRLCQGEISPPRLLWEDPLRDLVIYWYRYWKVGLAENIVTGTSIDKFLTQRVTAYERMSHWILRNCLVHVFPSIVFPIQLRAMQPSTSGQWRL